MSEPRICIVGGGSAYMPGIAFAIAHLHASFAGATVVLQDIDGDALELQARLTRSILRSRGAPDIAVEATGDRRRAIDGADLILTAFRPGGLPARHLDERIAIDHGVVGQETAGPGGFAMALRSIPSCSRSRRRCGPSERPRPSCSTTRTRSRSSARR